MKKIPFLILTTAAVLSFNSYSAQKKAEGNGIGFSEEYSQRIFELFSRLHNKDEIAGTGIGLAICKKIVENHKGYVLAKGKPGEGAVFEIYLPEDIA